MRSWIEALPLHIARPAGDLDYFRSAKKALARLASAKRHAQRSRQGTELAAHARRALHADRFPARDALLAASWAVPARGLRGFAASPQTQAPLRARKPDRERETHSCTQEPADPHLDGDRKARLLLDHARHSQFHRPRRRRPASGQRRARARLAAERASCRARRRDRRLSRPPHRDGPLCVCRKRKPGRKRPRRSSVRIVGQAAGTPADRGRAAARE